MYSSTGMIIYLIVRIFQIYRYLLLARVLLSWFIRNPENQIYHFLYSITEPILAPIRRIIPAMGFDLSPIIAFILIDIAGRLLMSII